MKANANAKPAEHPLTAFRISFLHNKGQPKWASPAQVANSPEFGQEVDWSTSSYRFLVMRTSVALAFRRTGFQRLPACLQDPPVSRIRPSPGSAWPVSYNYETFAEARWLRVETGWQPVLRRTLVFQHAEYIVPRDLGCSIEESQVDEECAAYHVSARAFE